MKISSFVPNQEYMMEPKRQNSLPESDTGKKVCWTAPANIALVKYWGKRDVQLPMNPSLSMSLACASTTTCIHYRQADRGGFSFEFQFEGRPEDSFKPKIRRFFDYARPFYSSFQDLDILIESSNTFPHSSGIASSASSMAALSLCMLSVDEEITGIRSPMDEFRRKASLLARLGSGSASRSVYGGYAVWGRTPAVEGSSDEYALPLTQGIHPFFHGIRDAILVVSTHRKSIGSSAGHSRMRDHPFAPVRYREAAEQVKDLIAALKQGDRQRFTEIVEREALMLHALMMSSHPAFLLLEPGTLELIRRIRNYRQQTGAFIAFTLDAGPNVHLLFHEQDRDETEFFIQNDLMKFCENNMIIYDRLGNGPYENPDNQL